MRLELPPMARPLLGAALSAALMATPPALALHVRAMSDYRAKNLTVSEQASQMLNALQCVQRALHRLWLL